MNTIAILSNIWAISGIILGLGFICMFDRLERNVYASAKKFPMFPLAFFQGVALIAVLLFILIPVVNTFMAYKVLRHVVRYVWRLRYPV